MQVPGSDNAGPRSDIFGTKLMSEGKETLSEKEGKKVECILSLTVVWFDTIMTVQTIPSPQSIPPPQTSGDSDEH